MYSISEIAQKTNRSIHTLRYYESSGLLPNVAKDSAGRRSYSKTDLKTLEFVKALRRTGMPIRQIKHYGELYLQGRKQNPQRKALLETHRDTIIDEIEKQKQYLKLIEAKIASSF
jgi:DNA-binding transcriptional MerR regulator